MRLHPVLALLLLATACGGDDAPPPSVKGATASAGKVTPAQKAAADKKKLQPRTHVEERVNCPAVEKATGAECKIEAPACEQGLYCLPTPTGAHCEPCPERESIRHEFKDRDFLADVRNPFQSYTIGPVIPIVVTRDEHTKECTRDDQLVATNYSYQDLRLVGIVAQGTQRKVLMMDTGNLGHIIKRGDCVGKEKAVVKDIGTGYVTFRISFDQITKGSQRPDEEHSVQLHPTSLEVPVQSAPESAPTTVVAPPSVPVNVAPPPAPAPAPVPPPAPTPKKP